jgi:succinate dehydrogenase hydrophobic anchor subunit
MSFITKEDIVMMAELSCILITFLFFFIIFFSIQSDFVVIMKFNHYNEGIFELLLFFIVGTIAYHSWCKRAIKKKRKPDG